MDNEIQKLKTKEDNLKSKASQQHDYKNVELRRSKDGKNPELKGDDGKLLKTYNVCLNIVIENFVGNLAVISETQGEASFEASVCAKILGGEALGDRSRGKDPMRELEQRGRLRVGYSFLS
ncbi:hypothetical protein H5410_002066 [Solanum commersonii]|uniref:Uncharacterized protein n=1 Tax=Solanum commersonii TaxID=4109 RepID=A0A9J6B0L3_SOLCO|nr:hypothetical protein H5410_002066 [Solanum commersonii]